MADFILLFVLIIFHCVNCSRGIPTLQELCPARNFCKTNATMVFQTYDSESCCQSCSCSDTCLVTGNCCPDYDIIDDVIEDLPPPPPCSDMGALLNSERYPKHVDQTYFRVITTCPHTNTSTLDTRMIELCNVPASLVDYIPVSSKDGNKVYRNQHCARCHGETELVYWDIYALECYQLFQQKLTHVQNRDKLILENCPLAARPPNYAYAQNVICRVKTINSCNVTGKWDVFDSDLERACTTETPRVNSMYRHGDKDTFERVYANVYCYLCNIKHSDAITSGHNTCSQQFFIGDRFANYPLTILLNTIGQRPGAMSLEELSRSRCADSGHTFDKYTHSCRQVYCRLDMMPVYSTCQSIGQAAGLGFMAIFRVSDDWANTFDNSKSRRDWLPREAVTLINSFDTKLDSGALLDCDVDHIKTFLYKTRFGQFYIGSRLLCSAAYSCDLSKILKALNAIVGKDNVLELPNAMTVTVTLDIDLRLDDSTTDVEYGTTMDHYTNILNLLVTRELLQACPRIRLPLSQLRTTLISKELLARFVEARIAPKVVSNTTNALTICIGDYMALMQSLVTSKAGTTSPFFTLCFVYSLIALSLILP